LKTKHSKAAQTKAFRTQKKNEHKSHDVYHERAPVRFTKKSIRQICWSLQETSAHSEGWWWLRLITGVIK